MKRLTIAALLLLSSCDMTKKKQPEIASPFRTPSATELFDLQSKCTAMGQKVLQSNVIGAALTQEQVSHYNPKDNRCYVRLTVSTADLTAPRDKYIQDTYLEDGQSGEILADTFVKGETKSGIVFDASLQKIMQEKKQSSTDFYAIRDLIDSFVATDRRP